MSILKLSILSTVENLHNSEKYEKGNTNSDESVKLQK